MNMKHSTQSATEKAQRKAEQQMRELERKLDTATVYSDTQREKRNATLREGEGKK